MWVHRTSLSILLIIYLNSSTCASIRDPTRPISILINEILQRWLDTFQWCKRRREGIVRNLKTSKIFSSKSLLNDRDCIRFRCFVAIFARTQNFSPRYETLAPSLPLASPMRAHRTNASPLLGWINYTISLLVPAPTIISPALLPFAGPLPMFPPSRALCFALWGDPWGK